MDISTLRTPTEKVLYPLALVFSALVWLGLLFAIGSFFFIRPVSTPTVSAEPCVYIFENSYYYLSQEQGKLLGKTCLSRADIPDEVYKNAVSGLALQKTQVSKFAFAGGASIILFYVLFFLFFIYVIHALAMAHIRLNGIRMSKTQYPTFYKIYEEAAQELGLTQIPHAYIINADGALNAFAIKITRKKMVVFFTELLEALIEGEKFDELHAVAAHELTHVRLKHVNYWIFLMPFMAFPFLGKMLSRAREFSADRGALAVIKNHHTVAQALVKLAAGRFIAKHINVEEYVNQPKTERGFFIWLAKIIATHPPIPYRIAALKNMLQE